MAYLRNFALATAISIGAMLPATAQDVTSETVVATVGDVEITVGHMIAMGISLPDEQRQMPLDVLFEGILERLIQQEAITQAQPDLSKLTKLQLENERRSLIASEVVNGLAGQVVVKPEDIKVAYDRRFADFSPAKEFNASHILVETEDEAKALVEELNGGADFAELAKIKSTGPSGPNGGELGWFGMGRMVPAFEAAVVGMETGQISAPVQTQFGWHVIILNDSRLPEVPSMESMTAELEAEIWRGQLQTQITEMVDAAGVVRGDLSAIGPDVLTKFELIE